MLKKAGFTKYSKTRFCTERRSKRLKEFWQKYPDAESSLRNWYNLTITSNWNNFAQLRQIFPNADLVKNLTVFNISGNKYRLIALVDFTYKKVLQRKGQQTNVHFQI